MEAPSGAPNQRLKNLWFTDWMLRRPCLSLFTTAIIPVILSIIALTRPISLDVGGMHDDPHGPPW